MFKTVSVFYLVCYCATIENSIAFLLLHVLFLFTDIVTNWTVGYWCPNERFPTCFKMHFASKIDLVELYFHELINYAFKFNA